MYPKILALAALAMLSLAALVGGTTASASVLKQTTAGGTDVLGVGAEIEATQEPAVTAILEDEFGLVALTCTSGFVRTKLERTTPTGQPRGKVTSMSFPFCGHSVGIISSGEWEFKNIAGTTDATLISSGWKANFFNTILAQNCTINTGSGVDLGTVTHATSNSGRATIDINALLPLEGCVSSTHRWTARYEVTKPLGLIFEAS